ncbi:MAG: sigma 54-interacting transcriptional regulator [Proteobacteria bacterium]|nr:sigma 54-interacting transcriptional regulator [Pseudomonadota bacterium]
MRFRGIEVSDLPDTLAAGDLFGAVAMPGFAALADAHPDGLMVLDAAGVVIAYNQAAASIHDLARDQAVGASIAELAERSALAFGELAEALQNDRRADLFATSSGGRGILVSVRPVRDRRRDTLLTLVVLRDLEVIDHQRDGARRGERFRFRDGAAGAPDEAGLLFDAAMERAVAFGIRALERRARVLITGETGVGKTAIARHLHRSALGQSHPFVHVNCGSVPESLFESEMFGYERGAFTGALQGGKKGLIETAGGGTLFLDEIGEIPLQSQAKLLKFLEDGTVQRIGAAAQRRVDVRVVAATNRDLPAMVAGGSFRRDLYHRLKVVTIDVAPLRARREGIAPLLDLMLARLNAGRTPALELDAACRARLLAHHFPGNVRELAHVVERLGIVVDATASLADLEGDPDFALAQQPEEARPAGGDGGLKARVQAFEEGLIDEAVRTLGSKRAAARALGVDIGTVVRKTQRRRRA